MNKEPVATAGDAPETGPAERDDARPVTALDTAVSNWVRHVTGLNGFAAPEAVEQNDTQPAGEGTNI